MTMTNAKFSARHYVAIAAAFAELPAGASKYDAFVAMMRLFGADNPRFNRERFERACFVGADAKALAAQEAAWRDMDAQWLEAAE